MKGSCTMDKKTKCTYCNKLGHQEAVCFSKFRDKKNGKPKQAAMEVKTEERRRPSDGSPAGAGRSQTPGPTDREQGCKVEVKEVVNSTSGGSLKRLDMELRRLRRDKKTFHCKGLLDSGCSKTLMSSTLARKMGLKLDNSSVKLLNASGDEMAVDGVSKLWIATPVTKFLKRIEVIVTPSLPDEEQLLVGLPALVHLHLLPKNWPVCREADPEEEEKEEWEDEEEEAGEAARTTP